jgi:lysophospholipase L1-like esterase
VLCASAPLAHVKTRRVTIVATPACTTPLRWSVARGPAHGALRRGASQVAYRSKAGHRGWDGFVLRGRPLGASREGRAAAAAAVDVPVPLQVGSGLAPTTSVRAIGDSVTAGFGYYYDRSEMGITQLPWCKPGATLVDACSSNSLTRSNTGTLQYAPDYGLSNLIAWPARWAGWNGITNFANYAVTGSAPGDWAPGGQFHRYTAAAMAARPDYLVFSLGANPLLSDVLFGIDTMKCALWSDLFGNFTTCVTNAFASVRLTQNLTALYSDLVANTPASTQLMVMQYHLAIPSSALAYSSTQLERMSELLNQTIAQTAAATSPRLRVIAPPRFNVGLDMSPLYPSNYDCGDGGKVDGASVQSTATQDELEYDPIGGAFCPGPIKIGPSNPLPWIISGDTGIHPSATGHRMMANALPTP